MIIESGNNMTPQQQIPFIKPRSKPECNNYIYSFSFPMLSRAINPALRQYSSSTSKNIHVVASKGFNLQTDAYGKINVVL